MSWELFLQSLMVSLSVGAIYILIAVGLTLIFGILNVVNFAHGEMYMLGAYATYYLFHLLAVNYFLTLIIAMVLVGALGMALERLFFRPLQDNTLGVVIVAMGLSMFLQSAAYIVFGTQDKGVPPVFPGVATFFDVTISYENLITILVAVVLMLALHFLISRTKIGLAMRAVEQDRQVAALQGINTTRISSFGFGVGCALAAASGVLIAPLVYATPTMGFTPLMKGFIIIVVGGMGSVIGATVAGFLIAFIDSFGTVLIGTELAGVASFAFLIVILLIRPRGLLGRA